MPTPILSLHLTIKNFVETHPTVATITGVAAQVIAWLIDNHMRVFASLTALGGVVVIYYTARMKAYQWKNREKLIKKDE